MAWTGKNGTHSGDSGEQDDVAPRLTWKALLGWIAVLGMVGGLGVTVYAGGQAMERKAEKVEVRAVQESLRDATAKARAEYDSRLDRLEQERADHAATLRAINQRLESIDNKLNRNERTPRRTP